MNKTIPTIIIALIMLAITIIGATAELIYQENANSTSCEGIWWDSQDYTCAKTTDENWTTFGMPEGTTPETTVIININYTKASNKATWRVKDGLGEINITIPQDCFDYDENKIILRGKAYTNEGFYWSTDWNCYNGTWKILRESFQNADQSYGKIYEEAIYWNTSCSNDTECNQCQKCEAETCINQNTTEDTKNECEETTNCLNAYTIQTQNGYCNGAGNCSIEHSNITTGDVCYLGISSNPNATTNCGIWQECITNQTNSNEFYTGYFGDGTNTCTANDWQNKGTSKTYESPITQTQNTSSCSYLFDGTIESGNYYLNQSYQVNSTQNIQSNTIFDCQKQTLNKNFTETQLFEINGANNISLINCIYNIENGMLIKIFNSSNIIITGLSVTGTDILYNITGVTNFTFKDSTIENATFPTNAIIITDSENIIINNNTFNNVITQSNTIYLRNTTLLMENNTYNNITGEPYVININDGTSTINNNQITNTNFSKVSGGFLYTNLANNITFENNSFSELSGYANTTFGQKIINIEYSKQTIITSNNINNIFDLQSIRLYFSNNTIIENNTIGKHLLSNYTITTFLSPQTTIAITNPFNLLIQNNIFNESRSVTTTSPINNILFFNNTIILPEFQISGGTLFHTAGCPNCTSDSNTFIYNYNNNYTKYNMGTVCNLYNNKIIINAPPTDRVVILGTLNMDVAKCTNGLIENNSLVGGISGSSSLTPSYVTNFTIRNNNFTMWSYYSSAISTVPSLSQALLFFSWRNTTYLDIYNNNFITLDQSTMPINVRTRSASGIIIANIHDNNFTNGNIYFSARKDYSDGVIPIINFYNNDCNNQIIYYAILNDTISNKNYINITNNNFHNATLNIFPHRSLFGTTTGYIINIGSITTEEIWQETTIHTINVSHQFIHIELAYPNRTIDGQGLTIENAELGNHSTSTILKNFMLNNPVNDIEGTGQYINDTPLYLIHTEFDISDITKFITIPTGNNFIGIINNTNGIINFTAPTDLTGTYNLDSAIDINHNTITINSIILTQTNNAPARLTFLNTGYTLINDFNILKDGTKCNDCNNIAINNQDISFDVTGFSTYTLTNKSNTEQEVTSAVINTGINIIKGLATIGILLGITIMGAIILYAYNQLIRKK